MANVDADKRRRQKSQNGIEVKILEGVTFCLAHPLYRPQTWKGNILETTFA